ncbi:MAG: FKBP-type peptidyl-prolyl cis-trans isomerase N-terminal domain-containing protein [Planctomycetota bacterium]|jgi:FKBP-type peptidyl-prolyl cis-trans isomerase FklB
MRLLLTAIVGIAIGAGLLYQEPDEQTGYAVGFRLGEETSQGLALDGVGANLDFVIQGFADGLENNAPAMDPQQLHTILTAVHREMQDRMVNRLLAEDPQFRQLYDDNLDRSRAFHEAFGEREGVVTLPDGLQYEVIRPGTGPSPGPADVVVANYRMILLDKAQIARGENAEIVVGDVFDAAGRTLQMMAVGARWYVAFPPDLAFGATGRYPEVGPNETILGSIELIAIKEDPGP